MSEEKKQRLKEHQKNYREVKKSLNIIINKNNFFNCDLIINKILFYYDLIKYPT